jgi:peroxidase
MDVLPNIDLSDVMEIPKVFQCDEQTLPCDHTTKYRTITGRASKKTKIKKFLS